METKKINGRVVSNGKRHDYSAADGAGERVDLPITGMTCAACANRIEKKLKKKFEFMDTTEITVVIGGLVFIGLTLW